MTTVDVLANDKLAGRLANGDRIYLLVRLSHPDGPRWTEGPRQTVNHRFIDDPVRLSITGLAVGKHRQLANAHSAGQIVDDFAELVDAGSLEPWLKSDGEWLLGVWRDWHLNDMQPGCAHQTVVYEQAPYGGERASLTLTQPCPITGYKYGTAWLVKPLPDELISQLHTLFEQGD
jgi:hypothetical protein